MAPYSSEAILRDGASVTIRALTAADPDGAVAAIVRTPAGERALGIGRYVVLSDGRSAEVAFEVGDADQGRGIGTLLLEHLAINARRRGVATFIAERSEE